MHGYVCIVRFYLALPPAIFGVVCRTLRDVCWSASGWNRVRTHCTRLSCLCARWMDLCGNGPKRDGVEVVTMLIWKAEVGIGRSAGYALTSCVDRSTTCNTAYTTLRRTAYVEPAARPLLQHVVLLQHAVPCCNSRVAIWGACRQIVIEKPFGVDLDTSNALARELSACLAEPEMYRIDHYLGKEMVQNLFALRCVRYSSQPLHPINAYHAATQARVAAQCRSLHW